MVKGISKKIVLVPSPDKKLFEQAIFIVSDGASTDQDVLDKALAVAEDYLKKGKTINQKFRYLMFFLTGIGVSVLTNVIYNLVF